LKTQHIKQIKKLSWVLFTVYLILMAYFLFFSEYLNRSTLGTEYRYNLTLFREVKRSFWCLHAGNQDYFILNFVFNIVAFIPFGFFLPFLSRERKGRKFLYVMFSAFLFTLSIEVLQLVLKVGTFDVDDIFLNTVGGFIGFILFKTTKGVHTLIRKGVNK